MVAHFNISQADEWADKGKIAREGQLFHAIRRFEADVLPRVDGLVYVSEFMRKAIEQRIPAVARVPSVVVPNFLAPAAGQPNSEAKADLVSIGTLEPRKNQEYLLRILAAAARRGRRFTLALIGDGPDRARLERLANELGVADQVHFLGFVPHAAQCLPHYRAYCHAARMESFGLAILEAMSYGRPVLAAPVGGVPEVFADGSEGRYWPLDDADAAAGILIEMFSDADQLARMGGAARETFLTRFQTNVLGARLLAFLQFEPNAVSP
jgi:glycosyltransferase involved in cell wall biosynthesis